MASQFTRLADGTVALNVHASGSGGGATDLTAVNTAISAVDTKVGALASLTTTAKTSAVAAINEVDASVDTIANNLDKTANLWLPSGTRARVYVIFGQSNAAGAAPISDFSPQLRAVRSRTFTKAGSWNALSLVPLAPGVNNRTAPNSAGFDLALSLALEAAYPVDQIYLINLSWGGTSLALDWAADSGFYFQSFSFELRQVFKKLPQNAVLCGFLWNQGEGDVSPPASTRYKTNLTRMVNRLRELFGLCPFVAGRIQQGSGAGPRLAVQELAAELPLFDWIDQDELPFDTTGVHYTASGYNTIGERYANVLIGRNTFSPIRRTGEISTKSDFAHAQEGIWQSISALSPGILVRASGAIRGTASAPGTFRCDLSLFTTTDTEQVILAVSFPVAVGTFNLNIQENLLAQVRTDIKFYRIRLFPADGAALVYGGSFHLFTET